MPARFETPQPDLSRLQAQLLTSGLQQKDNALFQVISTLIDYVRRIQTTTNASIISSGAGKTSVFQTINLIDLSGGDGGEGDMGPPGLTGVNGLPGPVGPIGAIIFPPDAEDGDMFPPIAGPQGNPGPTGSQGPIGPVMLVEDGIDGEDGSPGPAGTGGGGGTSLGENVIVWHDASQSIPHNTWTTINFNTEENDTDGFHDNVTNNSRLTIPAGLGGIYAVFSHVGFDANTTGIRGSEIKINGTGFTRPLNGRANAATAFSNYLTIAGMLKLSAGDFIEIQVFQNSGGALNCGAPSPRGNNTSQFEIVRVGA